MHFAGKVVVITGAGAGLGRASAFLFAEAGARVVLGSRDEQRNTATIEEVRRRGGEAVGRQIDVAVESDVAGLIELAESTYGRVDVVFNNAGMPPPGNGTIPFEEIAGEDWQRLVSVNLSGVVYGCKHAVAPLRRSGGGAIVNSSSGAAFATLPGWAPYAATKGGINALTRALAVDLGQHNIRVNAICPAIGVSANFHQPKGSPVLDDDELVKSWNPEGSQYPLKATRAPRLSDSARLALYLASDDAAFITGQCVAVDGGLLSRMADPFTPEYREAQRRAREAPRTDA